MNRTYLCIVICLFFSCGCSNSPRVLLIDSFEQEISPETVDFGSGGGSSLVVKADGTIKFCGNQSLKLDYNLKPSGYMWVARGYGLDIPGAAAWLVNPEEINWKRYNSIALEMYGSNSGGVIAFDIKDNQGELWRFLLDDDFEGWKRIICPFTLFFPRNDWQPEAAVNDEVLEFPLLSFQFEPRLPGKGVYYFDCVELTSEISK